ncbi:hypothetical protein CAPTEDRAFT_211759 [Capitella teleta]|uniref:LRRCT domain-containing protein n=1 Tax=Capitella teleta TaxID=283909 RepID=R7T9S1_CAPTE|nr:hypothetical protein CAPTEDRAFT_211759 [Capitella teleta]|eukprot:ELT87739.1 hypothetical protein CAPTEDRAFT_211759 [Capitella teleta]
MATKRKITCVTLETKFLAISEKAIADKFGIPPSTLSTWIKNSEKIQAHWSRDIPLDVTSISLGDNSITTIGPKAFSNFTELKEVNHFANKISIIHDDAFSGLNKLRALSLTFNGLTEVPILEGLVLNSLQLGQNRIQLKESDFENVTIKHLEIMNNRIYGNLSAICKLSETLQVLYLHGNPLEERSPAELYNLIHSLSKAKVINLKFCGIASIPDLRPLNLELWIASNPFECDCRLTWMSDANIYDYIKLQCKSPDEFKWKKLHNILLDDLCPVQTLSLHASKLLPSHCTSLERIVVYRVKGLGVVDEQKPFRLLSNFLDYVSGYKDDVWCIFTRGEINASSDIVQSSNHSPVLHMLSMMPFIAVTTVAPPALRDSADIHLFLISSITHRAILPVESLIPLPGLVIFLFVGAFSW